MPELSSNQLNLNLLCAGYPGIHPSKGRYLCEASALCFSNQFHNSGIELVVGGQDKPFYVIWNNQITDQLRRSFADQKELTEYGAEGVAILLILEIKDEFTIVERASIGTGFDYWLGKKDQSLPFANGTARLEISGIMTANPKNNIQIRLEKKKTQIKQSDNSRLPAYIVIIEFSKPESHIEEKLF